ncbi:WD40/YVTN/BNR-like repeat-containing protein [Deinococcus humi]|uniref:Photosystem II stability/assembly factor-like uncharacterized protein n=1 Tax=Deinococcus humi TaxID=662880 RepID=A0A7W8JZC1_9DEIO|nr:photosystem II stability/assembly factor-like uncharacterized protein [Deinococcus humi]GGO39671.1 S-layer protein [Deinococcus humi]
MTKQPATRPVPPASSGPRLGGPWLPAALLILGLVGGGLWWGQSIRAPAPTVLEGDFHALRVLPDGTLLYGQHAGVSISTDEGRTWSAPNGAGDAMALAAAPAGPVLVMAGHDVLKVSQDGGQSWQAHPFGTLPSTDIHGFTVLPDAPGTWYANLAGAGLYRTTDGRTWRPVTAVTGSAMALAAGPSSRLYALGAQLLVSDDAVTWQQAQHAPAASAIDVHPLTGHVYLAGWAGVFRSTDQAATWEKLPFPESARLVAVSPQNDRQLYAVGGSGKVYRSQDGGATWGP